MRKYIFAFVMIMLVALITGCSEKPTPEQRFAEYVKLWNKQDFAKMYGYLSEDSKQNISKDDFVERYTKIYEDLDINNLDVQFKKPEEEAETKEGTVNLPFSVKMDTMAGPIEFDQQATIVHEEREKEENWYLEWETGFIFPDLEGNDKVRLSFTSAVRGEILDREGKPLATNGQAFSIGFVPEKMGENPEESIAKLAEELQISTESIEKALSASWVQPHHFVPVAKISEQETELLEKLYEIDGVNKQNIGARVYPLGEAAAHLIGNIGPITAEELEKRADEGYKSTDMIGKRGLEQVLDKKLKGKSGVKIYIEKENGETIQLAEKEVQNGENVKLTIDANLQQKIFKELTGDAGTGAAMDPITGETLALVSSPSFDPNKMTLGLSGADLKALEENEQNPLLNRFKSTYAPGSVLKPLTAAVGLTEGTLDPAKALNIKGLTWQKDSSWGTYKITRVTDPKTPVDLEKALLYSDNIYFGQTALELGKDRFTAGLKKFGFEEELDYLYPMQTSKIGKLDSEIMLADSGYGQGQVQTNILHLSAAYTPFLNGGNLIRPILTMEEEKGQVWKENIVTAAHAKLISDILLEVVEDPRGTAHNGKISGISLAGKTGTAEIKAKQGESGQELGWFIGYKTDAPHLMITMMIEDVQDRGGSHYTVKKVSNIFK